MKNILKTTALVLAFGVCSTANAAKLVLDDFDTGQTNLTVTPIATTDSSNGFGIGDFSAWRAMRLEHVGGFGDSTAKIFTPPGVYAWSNEATGTKSIAELDYRFSATDVSSLSNFQANVVGVDLGFFFTVRFGSVGGGFTSITLVSSGLTGIANFNLSNWLIPAVACPTDYDPPEGGVVGFDCNGNLDFANLNRVTITFISVAGREDLEIDEFAFVPVPGTLLLIGAGLLGFGLVRRRGNLQVAA